MSIGVKVQGKQNQSPKEILHSLTSQIQENSFTKTKLLYLIKLMDICYNKGLTIQIITTHKIWMRYFIMIGYILRSFRAQKTLIRRFMLST